MYLRKGVLGALFFFVICNLSCRKMFPIEEIEVRGILVDTKDYLPVANKRVVIWRNIADRTYENLEKVLVAETMTDSNGKFDMIFKPSKDEEYTVSVELDSWSKMDIRGRIPEVISSVLVDKEKKKQDVILEITPYWVLKMHVISDTVYNSNPDICFHSLRYLFDEVCFQGRLIDTIFYASIDYENLWHKIRYTINESKVLGSISDEKKLPVQKFDTSTFFIYY